MTTHCKEPTWLHHDDFLSVVVHDNLGDISSGYVQDAAPILLRIVVLNDLDRAIPTENIGLNLMRNRRMQNLQVCEKV